MSTFQIRDQSSTAISLTKIPLVDIYKKISLTCNERWFQLYSGQLLSCKECPPGRCVLPRASNRIQTRPQDRQHALLWSQNSRSPLPLYPALKATKLVEHAVKPWHQRPPYLDVFIIVHLRAWRSVEGPVSGSPRRRAMLFQLHQCLNKDVPGHRVAFLI